MLSREKIAKKLVLKMSVKELEQAVYEHYLDWLDDIGSEEIKEIYENEPELWEDK